MSVTLPLNRHSIEVVVEQLREDTRRHYLELNTRKEPMMSDLKAPISPMTDRGSAVERLLFVADAAVADVHDLPPVPRALIESAAEVHALTPALPGRLAWLADDVDRFRHVADERLDTVLDHLHEIHVDAHGVAGRGSLLTVIADAVADFAPDHILLALRGAGHHNWQERRLIAHVEDRFRLPVITYAVDAQGHTASAAGPLLLCFDGSADAARAIEHAGLLFPAGRAILASVWQQPLSALGGIAWGDETPSMAGVEELDQVAAERAGRVAADGLRIAERAGLSVESRVVTGSGPISSTILELAERNDAAAIVMGSRGLSGLGSIVLGSVSNAVVAHAHRPTLVIRHSSRPADDHAA
jgi:nucleotide-binding universal stress UspA family protein